MRYGSSRGNREQMDLSDAEEIKSIGLMTDWM